MEIRHALEWMQPCEIGRSTAELCDRKMHMKLTRKIFRTVVGIMPALVYGAETCWCLRKKWVSEPLVGLVEEMYHRATTRVRTEYGVSAELSVIVG